MDAFDNPARNGMAGLQRDGLPTDQSSGAVAGSDLLSATARATATASAMPLAIQAILVPDASGRIVLPAGASIDDISVSGTDLIVTLPNGQVLIVPNGAVDVPAIVVDGDTVPASTVAQLLEGLADFNPEAGIRSSGGNFADPEGPIQDAYALGDLLPYTELAFPQPEDRELLPDVPDEEPEVVIVTPDQPAGATAATASVDEAGLPARGGEPAGSDSAANSESTTGTIVYDVADGLGAITINGTAITAVGQVVTTPLGQLTITSLTPGSVGYSYTLADNTDANANLTDVFTVVITDRDGDSATATLTIDVIDDVPTARADTDTVAAGSFAPETGNVLTGAGTTSGSAGIDTPGADGATLTGVRPAGGEGGFSAPGTVTGQYGTLTLNADGSYSYVRNPGTPGGVDDVFAYQITDGDGDTSTATLTIGIADSPTVITFVPGDGGGDGGTIVYEADLPGRNGETPGSAFGGGGGGASTSGTITFTAIDGVGSVSLGGTVITPGSLPQTVSSDATGTLVVTGYSYDPATGAGSITYVYTLIDNTLDSDGTTVSFDITVTDADGDSASDTLDILIVDDVPTARDDADSVTEDGPLVADGNVLTGLGGGDANATDGVADTQGADGASVTALAGGSVGAPLAGAYGTLTLNADGSYSYVLNNAAQPVQGLSAGETLTEIFTYTITDGDGDTSSATLTITINGADDGVTITGLDAEGGELTLDEDDLADGSSPDAAALTQTGSFTVSTPDGLGNVTVGGTQVVTNGVFTAGTATSPLGTVNITGFTPVTGADGSVIGGTFTYEYVLADNTLTHASPGEDNVTDSFAVVVTDGDGSTASASLDVRIIDDVPTARADVDSVTEDGPLTADGNVLTGLGGGDANATDGVADTQGADGASVTAIAGGTVGTPFATAYGTLTLNADGSYSYVLNNAAQPVQGLSAGETLTETFTYTITDGDGDTSSATLTITINGADDGVTITGLDAVGAEVTVDEDDLADGSSPDAAALTQANSFTISTPDGLGNVTIGGTQVVTNGVFTAGTATSPLGTVNITGFTPLVGTDGSVIGGSFTYEYVLADNTLTHASPGEDNVTDSFAVVVTDSDGSIANASLDVRIVDDVPTAADDSASAAEDTPVVIDVLANDVRGADGIDALTGVALAAAPTKGVVVYNGDGTFTYTPTAGEEGEDSFTYTITDGDGDISTATVTVTLAKDSVPTIDLGADNSVDEAGLPNGSNAASNSETATGGFTLTTGNDSVASLVINGVDVTAGGTVTTPIGVLTVMVSGGVYSYSYTLTTNTSGDNTFDSFTAVVTDSDGDTATDTLVIDIVDDVPTARDDADSVTEDGPLVADGNVLTGSGGSDANDSDGVADTQGADGASVTALAGGSVGAPLAGAYGTLTLNADGSYSYVLNNAAQPVQGLSAGETLTEIFTYTITDGDGDTSSATLTITINGADDGVTISGLDAAGAELFVDEDDLPARTGEAAGSDSTPDSVTDSNSFTVSTPDGMGTVVLTSFNGVPLGTPLTLVVANGSFTPQSVATSYGTLNVTGFTPVTGGDGSVIGGTFTYSYTLTDNRTDHPAAGQDDRTDSVGVTVTDIDGSSASATIDIRITDDVPDAIDDAATQTVENSPVTINVLANDVQGADSVQPSAVELVAGSLTGTGTLVNNGDGSFTYTPGAQETGTISFQYRVTDGDNDSDVATATITLVADSAPQIRSASDVTVDEDGLPGANADNGLAGEVTSTGSASASGTITVDFGSDVPATLAGSLVLNDSAALDTQLTVNAVPVTFEKVGNDLVGSVGGNEVIRISLTTATAGPGATEVTYGYSVILSQAVDQAVPGSEDSDLLSGIGFTVTDNDGTQASGSFGITIVDDLPTLNVSDTPTSVVEGATANGSWALDAGADGVTAVNVTFGSGSATLALTPGSSVSITQPTGTLTVNSNGSFSFAAAGNQNNAANPSASFTLSAVDRDGDPTSDSLTIAILDGANPGGATPITLTVNEAALDAIGSNPASNEETASGTLSFTAGSDALSGFAFTGVAGLVANLDGAGTDLYWSMAPDGQTIIGALTSGGPAAITISLTAPASIAPGATASATVTVTLADNLPHALAMAAQAQALGMVTVQATDTDGDLATGAVTVQVIDDIPAANADVDSVTEDGPLVADGNVLTGSGGSDANDSDGVADTQGADGATVTAVAGGAVGAPLVSTYGTLTLNADGSYSYILDNSNTAVQGLSAGQTLTETFTYTITDGDGDPSSATLTITINGADDGVTITGLDVAGGEEVVNEDDLADGSSPDAAALTQPGSFTISTPDGLGNVTIGSAQVVTNGVFTPGLTTSSALGTVTITGFTPVLASDGSVIGGTFTYEYVLDDNTLTHPAAGEDNVTDSFAVTVTDSDGSTANASLDITVIDDVPTAAAEANQNVAEGATVTGTLDFIQGADGASVTAINGTTLVFGMDGFSQAIDIGDGTIKIKADGSYSFTADASVAGTGSASATYTVTDGDGDISTAPISFTIVDANAPTAGQTEASVDDDALSGGNPASMTGDLPDANSDGDNNQATFSGLLNLDFGGDGAGSVHFAAMHGMFVTIGQESVQLTWNGGTNTLTGTGPRGALFTVELTDPTTGAYKVTLLDNVLHTPGGDENDATAVLGFTVIDSDGSTASGTLRITFDDDAPTVTASGTQPVLTVDESALGVDAQASFASVFTPVFGADGAALANDTTYTLGIGVGATGLIDSATNEAVVLHLNGNVVEGRTVTSDALVFTVSVAANGTVTLDQLRAVLHTPDSGVDQPTGLVADDLITLTATVTDGDGDSATATANIGQNLVFRDDAPVANDDAAGLTEGGPSSVTFDVDTNDNAGADGVGSRIFTSLTGSYGTITLNGDGTQTYTLTPAGQAAIDALAPGATLTDVFTYTLTDKDGDSDPATLTITLTGTDDGVTITNLTPKLDGGDATVDEDDLPAGSDTAKESLTATGSFNISAPDGVADLSIHGTQVIANGVFTPATIVTPLGNTLDITAYNPATGEVSYSYTLNAAETHAGIQGENSLFEDFVVDLTDTDGDQTDSILSINIVDDVPTAASDPAIVVAEDAAPVGGNLLANDVQGADGATVTSVTIGGNVTSINAVGTTVVVTANGTYSFTATGVWSFDPNPVSNAAPVDAGFTYTITDGDGDTSTAAQAISLVDGNGPGNAGSITLALDDQNLADGSTPAGPDFDSDTLVFTQGSDAITSIVFANSVAGLGGGLTWLRVSDTQITGSDGARLVVTLDLVRSGDSATITATLNDNYDGHTGIDVDDLVNLGSVGVVATDADGDTATGSVTVTISDDLPTARPDTDSVTEDAPGDATGNVITGVGTTNSPGSADTQGADGAAVTGVAAGMSPTAVSGNVGSALAGSYGTLTLNANGGYTYTLNNANGTVQALGVGDTLTETFTYTITDGDNDTSTTTLTITINGANDAPTIGSATTAVSDEGLAGGLPDNMGTVDTTNLAVRMGTIAVNDVDGDALTVSLGTPATALFSGGQPVVWDTTNPQLLLGKVGTETIISVSINNSGNFTVTLSGPIDHPDTTQEDALSLVVPVSVNDGTTTVTNATALTIGLEDDSPIAVSPFGTSLTNVGGASVLQFLDADNDVDNNFGGDGGKVIFTAATIAALEAQDLTSGLAPLTYSISNGGQVLTAEKANGDDVFIITLQPAGSPDQYRVEIIRPLDAVTEVDFNAAGYDFSGGNPAWNFFRDAGTADSKDILLTPIGPNGQTVNTNANSGGIGGGGGGGAIGTGEGMRIDFVIDLLGNPASGGAGYQVPANRNHSFSDHYVVNGASAVFASTSGSTVRFATKDDPDGNDAVGDGAADPITAVAIRFGAQTVTVNASATPQPVTVGGQNYTVTFVGGEVLISGIVTNTQVALFTADGYNSMEITYVSGSDFRIGDFGASAITTTDPVPFTVPVAVIDGDGDTSALADINITANPAPPPVVLDLDGDGIEYLSAASGVTFDYAGDGHASTTAWVGPNDGLLAFDANGNGRVDNGTEIVFGGNGLTDLQGLAARFDSNGDGVLDRHDADFARFGVWQDANSNGVADDGEFRTLDQAGIVSINLVSDGRPHTTANGDVHVFGESSYTLADGTVRIVADAAFANTGIARTQDRPATAMLLTDALVAASLITMAQGAQADERVSPRSVAEDEFLPRTVDEAAAPAAVAETTDSTVLLDQGTVVATAAARAVDTAAHHADTAFQVNASIADSRDYGWRGEDMIAKDGGSTDALFDAPSATAGTASAMDGLLMLGLAAAEAAAAQAASVSAPDPAATAVLAEVLDAGNAIDRLIDAVAGPARVEMAHTENPAFDLAALLDQNVTPDAAAVVPPSVELDLHQMATA